MPIFPTPNGVARSYERVRSYVHAFQKSSKNQALFAVSLVCLGAAWGLPGVASRLSLPLPVPWAQRGLVLAAAGCFLWLVIRLFREAPPRSTAPRPQPPAIIGTAPFGRSHGELFARLGRHMQLQEVGNFLAEPQTALVVIAGPAGAGKTSFIEAGLSHDLKRLGCPLLYWVADPKDPESKLLEAIRAQWEDEGSAPRQLQDLIGLRKGPRRAIVIDQLERLSPKHHEGFFHLLRRAVEANPPYGLTWIVVVQAEHLESWFNFRVSLGVSDRRIQERNLPRFSVPEAETVAATLLDAAELSIEKPVLRDLLADIAVEGEILPADLGIHLLALSSMAQSHGLDGFTPEDFRKIGGPLGLKSHYLKGQLARLPPRVREETTRALLQLVDPASGKPRPDGRTGDEIVHLVKPSSARELLAAMDLLTSASRLLLREASAEGQVSYRLPPGLAPAVQRIAGGAGFQASDILNNAYRIWRSDPKPRYLLSGKELRAVLRKREELLQEADPDKERFIERSRRRRTLRWGWITGVSLTIALGGFGFFEWREDVHFRQLLESWGLPRDLAESHIEELTVHRAVTRLDWLPKGLKRLSARNTRVASFRHLPAGLQRLDVAAAQGLTSLADLPAPLQELDISYTRGTAAAGLPASLLRLRMGGPFARSLIGLPEGLEALELVDSEIDSLEGLPGSLRSFTLLRSNVTSLEGLPQGVKSLVLKGTRIRSLAGLPPFLESLTLEKNEELTELGSLPPSPYLTSLTLVDTPLPDSLPPHLTSLSVTRGAWPDPARLPSSLTALTLIDTDLTGLEHLPPTVTSLALDAQRLDDLQRLPRRLTRLELKWYPGKDLRGLPPKLERLSVTFSGITSLQGIPESVTGLDLSGSDITDLRGLPPGLVRLKLQGIKIRRLPPLPASLVTLDLAGSTVAELGALPAGLATLNLARTRVRTLAGLPRTLESLDISGTPITDLGGRPPEIRELTLNPDQIKQIGDAVRSLKALHCAERPGSEGLIP